MVKLIPIVALLFLLSVSFAAVTVNYTGTTASVMNGATPLATVVLTNSVTWNGTDYIITDCSAHYCKLKLNITPYASITINGASTVRANLIANRLGTITNGTPTIYENRAVKMYYANNSTYFQNQTKWHPFNLTSIQAFRTYQIGLDYYKSDSRDSGDLVPNFYGINFSNWAMWLPYWGNNNTHDIAGCGTAGYALPLGVSFTATNDTNITALFISSSSTATNAAIINRGNGTIIQTVAISGTYAGYKTANFTNVTLTNGAQYAAYTSNAGARTYEVFCPPPNFPIAEQDLTFTGGYDNGAYDTANAYEIVSIWTNYSTASTPAGIAPSINFTSHTPANNSYLNTSQLITNTTFAGALDNFTLMVNSTAYLMEVIGSSANYTLSLADGNYAIRANGSNYTNLSINATTETRYITIDTTNASDIAFTAPTPNTYRFSNITFSFTFTEPNLKNCLLQINGTDYTPTNTTGGCTASVSLPAGNYTYFARATDKSNNTAQTINYSIYIFNFTVASTEYANPECDLQTDNQRLNITLSNYQGAIMGILEYGTTNYTAATTLSTNAASFNYTIYPASVATVTSIANRWFLTFINDPNIYATAYSLNVTPCGLLECGTISNTTAINYTTYDDITFTPLNSTATLTFTQSIGTFSKTKTIVFSTANFSKQICIFPTALSVTASTSEIWSATGYYSSTVSRMPASYSSALTNYSVYLSNATATIKLTEFSVYYPYGAPLAGAVINIFQQNTTSGSYYFLKSITTNSIGKSTTFMTPNTILYVYNVTDATGTSYAVYEPSFVTCGTFDSVCYVVLTLPQAALPYVYYLTTQNATCQWNNSSGILNCTTNYPLSWNVTQLKMYRVDWQNISYDCNNVTSGGGYSYCTVTNPSPNPSCFSFLFNGTTNSTSAEQISLAAGEVCFYRNITNMGSNGVVAALIIVLALGLIGMYFGVFGSIIGLILGIVIITLTSLIAIPLSASILLILGLLIIAYIVKKQEG